MNDRAPRSPEGPPPRAGRAPAGPPVDRSEDLTVGRRVAHHRRQRGLSQPQLADLVGRSTAWVSGVERGKYHLDRLPLLVKLSAALEVTVGDLFPEVVRWREDEPEVGDDPTGLVAVLGSFPVVGAMYGRPADLVDLDDLETRIDALVALEEAADHADAAQALVEVLTMAAMACVSDLPVVRSGGAAIDVRPYLLSSRAHSIAAKVLFRMGQFAAAWVAIDRSIVAAARGNDRTLMVSVVLRAGRLFLTDGRWTQAQAAAESVVAGLEATAADPSAAPADLAMAGAAHLILADLAASRWNRGTALAHLDHAEELGHRVGPDHHFYDTDFGPDEVALHRVIVAVGLQDAGDAVALARSLDSDRLTPERRARLLLHWSRAEILCRAPDRALALLVRADRLNPDQTAHFPLSWAAIEELGAMAVRIHDSGELARLRSRVRRPQ